MNICRLYLNSLDEAVQLMIIKAGKALKFLSFFLFIPSGGCVWGGGGEGRGEKPGREYCKNFELEMFSNCAGKHEKCDVTTSCVYIFSF